MEGRSPTMATRITIGLHEHLYMLPNIYTTLTLRQA